jgi:8-oxo-dGTP pyrophosphatase MutT (NUDIX family)
MIKKKIGAGILAIDRHSGQILICRRGMGGSFPNTWATFGGTFDEEDGTPKHTAKREFWEETQVEAPYQISTEPFYMNTNQFIDFYTYIGIFDGKPEVIINEESLGYAWVDLENMPFNLMPGFEEMLDAKRKELKKLISTLINTNY